jgi:hypothetical protein
MRVVSITSRARRVWLIATGVWVSTAAVFALLVTGQWLLYNKRPDVSDWVMLAVLPACFALGWLLYLRITSSQRARQLVADQRGVEIERLNGHIVSIPWQDIRAIEYNSLEQETLAFRTADSLVVVLAHAFSPDEWLEWVDMVLAHVEDQVEFHDKQRDFDRALTTWLNRASIGVVLAGGGATVLLAAWNPANATAWIVLVGTLALLACLGSWVISREQDPIPIAKVIGFFSIKMLAIVPVAVLVALLVRPMGFNPSAAKHAMLFYVSNGLFFGGMAAALIMGGGFSPMQYFRRQLRGWNRFHRHAIVVALALCAIGFVLKTWNGA